MADEYKLEIKAEVNIDGQDEIDKLGAKLKAREEELDRVKSTLQDTRDELEALQDKFNEFAEGSGLDIMEAELERFRELATRSAHELQSFLEAANLVDGWGGYNELFKEFFKDVEDGALTSSQAIVQIKTQFRELFEENFAKSGGLLDTQTIQQFSASLDQLGSKVSLVLKKVIELESAGAGGAGGGGTTGGISDIAAVIEQIRNSTEGMSEEAREAYTPISNLLGKMAEYGNLDERRILGVSQAFRNIADIGKGNYGNRSMDNIIALAERLSQISNGSVRFDFTGLDSLNNLSVKKSSLSNLATYLPQIAAVDMDKLKELASIDWTNLNNLKFGKGSANNLLSVTSMADSLANIERYLGAAQEQVEATNNLATETESAANAISNAHEKEANAAVAASEREVAATEEIIDIKKRLQRELHVDPSYDYSGFEAEGISALRSSASAYNAAQASLRKYAESEESVGAAARNAYAAVDEFAEKLYEAHELYKGDPAPDTLAELVRATMELNLAREEATTTLAAEKAETDAATASEREQQSVLKSSISAYNEALAALRKYEEAKNGDNPAAQQSYTDLENAATNVINVREAFQAEKATVEELADATGRLTMVRKEAETVLAEYLAQNRAAEKAEKQQKRSEDERARLLKNSITAYNKAQEALTKWSSAEKSSNEESRKAYATFKQETEAVKTLREGYNNNTVGAEELEKATQNLNIVQAESEEIFRRNGDLVMSFGGRLSQVASKFATWFSASRVIMALYRSIRQMISAAIELDSAMGQLQIVTRANSVEMEQYGEVAAKAAQRIGSSITDFTSSVTTFARLGYSLSESSQLAEFTGMLQNVGDIDVDDAQDAITAIVKAYGVSVNDIESVMDKLVTVGNNFPISVSQIATGMNNLSSTLAAAGNSFEESVALLTAANTTVQDAAKASTGLRTIAARIRNTKTELDDLGEEPLTEAKYDELIQQLTRYNVQLTDINGEYRSTYDIMKDIAAVWGQMSSMEQAALATALSGTRQQAIFYSIINQFQEASGAMDAMANSAGELSRAYSVYLGTAQAHINQFKAAFQQLSATVINTGLINSVVDLGRGILNLLTGLAKLINLLGGLQTVFYGVATAIALINAEKIMAGVKRAISGIGSVIAIFKNLNSTITASASTFFNFGKTLTSTTSTIMSAATAAQLAVGSFMALVGAVMLLYNAYQKKQDRANTAYQNALANLQERDSVYSAYEAYVKANEQLEAGIGTKDELKSATDALTSSLKLEGEAAEGTAESLKELTAEELQRAIYDSQDMVSAATSKLAGKATGYTIKFGLSGLSEGLNVFDTESARAAQLEQIYNQLLAKRDELRAANKQDTREYERIQEAITYLSGDVKDYTSAMDAAATAQERYNNVVNDTIHSGETEYFNNLAGAVHTYAEALSGFTGENGLSSFISDVTEQMTTLASLQEAVADGFTLTADEALKFASVYPQILDNATVAADGQIALNEGVVNDFIAGQRAEIDSSIDAQIAVLQAKRAEYEAELQFAQAKLNLLKQVGENEGQISLATARHKISIAQAVLEEMVKAGYSEVDANKAAVAVMSGNEESFGALAAAIADNMATNFAGASASAANSVYRNTKNMRDDLVAFIKQAYEAYKADASIGTTSFKASLAPVGGGSGGGTSAKTYSTTVTKKDYFKDAQATQRAGQGPMWDNSAELSSYSFTPVELSLDEWISELEIQVSDLSSGLAQIDGQISFLEALKTKTLDDFKSAAKGSTGGGGKGGSSSSKSTESEIKNWFKEQLALHQHFLEMDKETVADYVDWLEWAYKQAYEEGLITAEEYLKYEEEVYKKRRELFKDYLNDIEKEISLRQNFENENAKIVELYKQLMKDVEEELRKARANGLKDTDDYIQELQQKWFSYKDAIADLEDDIRKSAKDSIEKLIDIRIKMLKQDIQNEKDAIKKRLDYLKDFYDKQKEMLQDVYDEEKYLDQQREKRNAVADIQAQIAQLEFDNSAWAQRRKLELAQELAEAQKDLNEFEKDHALEMAQDQLDGLYEMQEKKLNAQTDLLDQQENDAKALYDRALEDIKNGSIQLYEEMINWNNLYGDGIEATIAEAWGEAYKALLDYKNLFNELYRDIELANATGVTTEGSWNTSAISERGALLAELRSMTGNAILTAVNTLLEKEKARQSVLNLLKKGYASGTKNATRGLHAFEELGTETTFESSDGNRYRMFTGGEKVLNAKASSFLYDFATGGKDLLGKIINGAINNTLGMIAPNNMVANVAMGDIIVQGNADRATVSEIRRAQRESVEYMLKEFNRLNK